MFACVACAVGSTDTADVGRVVEHGKFAGAFEHVHQFHELHTETHVGFVATEAAHGFVPGHAEEGGVAQIVVAHLLEEVFRESLEGVDDVVLLDVGHFAVNLREFRLAVGAQIFVAETLDDLEVAIHTGHHEQLLERLRALGQCVELAGIHA